jgi:hypothetical protein
METDVLDVGCRTFATALGKHHGTISRLLPMLEQASDGILTKIADARGRNADTYVIQLPQHFEQLARELPRSGKINGIPPYSVLWATSASFTNHRTGSPPPPRSNRPSQDQPHSC